MIKKLLWITFAFVIIGILFGYFASQIGGTESSIIQHAKRVERY